MGHGDLAGFVAARLRELEEAAQGGHGPPAEELRLARRLVSRASADHDAGALLAWALAWRDHPDFRDEWLDDEVD